LRVATPYEDIRDIGIGTWPVDSHAEKTHRAIKSEAGQPCRKKLGLDIEARSEGLKSNKEGRVGSQKASKVGQVE
jgi:hypothetical protein